VLYGAPGRLALTGSPGRGACARVEIPIDVDVDEPVAPERVREGGRISA
jgi:hypothetical protein